LEVEATAEPKAKKPKKPKAPSLAVQALTPETMSEAGEQRDLCKKCGLFSPTIQRPYVPGGYTGKLLVVLGSAPNSDERQLLRQVTREAGYSVQDVALTYAVRCPVEDEPSMNQIRCCRPFVARTVTGLNPQQIIAMGPSAARSLSNDGKATNITKMRGRPLRIAGTEKQAWATYAPRAVLLGGSSYLPRIKEDFERASKPLLPRPVNGYPDAGFIAIDTEYAPDKTLLTVGIADRQSATSAEPDEDSFYAVLSQVEQADNKTKLIGHSISGDIDKLVELGAARIDWVSGYMTLDSLLLARMKDENRGKGGYDLEGLLVSDRNVEPWKQDTVAISKEDATLWGRDLRKERCRLDAWASARLATELVIDDEVQKMPWNFVHRIAMSLHRVRHAGVYIDRKKLSDMELVLLFDRERARDKLTKLAFSQGMTEFIPTNDGHIRDLLFKRLKLPVTKKTKTSKLPAVDQITLKQFAERPEVKTLLEFNKADKAYTTNILGVKDLVQAQPDGRLWLPVNINPLGARTGRRSSSEPNMQNWPGKMRQLVVSRFPNGLILENDYKSLEIFILGYEAKDDKLIDYFLNRGGYIAIAKELWKMEVTKGTREYVATKSVVLGTNYNMQTKLMAETLWNKVGVRFSHNYEDHVEKTDELRRGYLRMFPGIPRYMARQKQYLLDHGYVVSKIGQVRHLPHDGPDTPGFGRLVNQAINFPIQSLAAAVTGSALLDCEAAFCAEYDISLVEYHDRLMRKDWPLMPLITNEVHDNLVFDMPDRRRDFAVRLIKECMESAKTLKGLLPGFSAPLKVDTKLGPHWGMEG
jgi:uracil-DNA glycosylase family 4